MKDLALTYINIMKDICENNENSIASIVEKHTLENVMKVINNQTICKSRNDLLQQLTDVRKMAGKMNINLVNYCNDTASNKCAVRYILKSELAGNFSTLAIINYDNDRKIKMIDEIYTQLESPGAVI